MPQWSWFLPAFDGFGSLGMLGWGALGGIPIVIHLLHRRRFRETTWAAMRFLLQATRKHARRIRLEQFILLAVRTAILLLLVLALARPYLASLGALFQADAPTHRIVVVDTSLSTSWQAGEQSHFEQAREMARQVVSSSQQGDALNLVRIGELPPTVVIDRPSYQKGQVLQELDTLQPTHEMGDVAMTLREVERLLGEASEIRQKEIVFLSDFQRTNWTPDIGNRRAQIQRVLKRLSEQARVYFVHVGQAQSPNLAVTDWTLRGESFVVTGRPVRFQATVENTSPSASGSRPIELHVDDRLVRTQHVDLLPGEEKTVDFEYIFSEADEHRVEVRLASGDALPVDDRRVLALPARERLNVLLVNGRFAGRPRDNATFYLEKVLQPSTSDQNWNGVTQPHVIRDGQELLSTDLSRYDCVFLCDVARITAEEATLLRNYAEGGGGLVICLGGRVQTGNYNQFLYADGKGVLPVRLGETVESREEPFLFDPADLKHPIVNAYAGNPDAGLESTLVFQYVRTQVPDGAQVETVINFTSGDPAILDAPLGRGRVILVTTSVDDIWGLWPIQPQTSFPPIVHETVRYVVAGRWAERNGQVGRPLSRTYRRGDVPVTIRRPDGERVSLRLAEADGLGRLAYTDTSLAGIYEVQLGAPLSRTELFAVNPDVRESRLTALAEADFENELLPGGKYSYLTSWEEPARERQADSAGRNGLVRWLLMAVLGLVFVEQMMAWRFHWGLALLGLIAGAAALSQAFAYSLGTGVVATAVIAAGVLMLLGFRRRAAASP